MYKGQIICCIIILFLSIFSFSSKTKKTKSSKWFLVLLVVSFFQFLFDIASVYTVNHLDTVPEFVNRLIHDFYMGLMLSIFYLANKYLEAVIEEEIGHRMKGWDYTVVPLILACAGVVCFPLDYMETPKGNYSYGPAAMMVYIGVAVYIILIVRMLFKYGKDIPHKKRNAMIIAMMCELGVALYQSAVPTALITCLGITLLNLGIYLTVENPDALLVEMLEEETKRADAANQAKTNFLANMSHEIRTPINAVLGMNEMILRESKEETIRDYAKDVQGAAKSLLGIINDILDINKIEAGKLAIIPVEYQFSALIHDVVSMISFKTNMKELELHVEVDGRIPDRLKGDDIRIRQILVNLLGNAVKYTQKGSVTLTAELLGEQALDEQAFAKRKEGSARILFAVKDTGIGIKEEDIPKLYVPFERIEEKRNRNIEGTGLGMNITVQFLQMLGSELKVKSEYGKGSEFSFVLEQEILDENPVGNILEHIQEQNETYDYQVTYEAPDAKILVVDDNEINRKVFCSLLKDTKIQISQACDGRECLEKVKDTAFDLIFMDHMMPELDGVETFRVMKAMEDYPNKNTPVVILTANAIVGAKEQYLKEGFCDFLSKPIDMKKLEKMVERLLDKNLLHYVERKADVQETGMIYDVEELPMIDGLDWGYAATHFKNQEDMIKTLRFFVSVIELEAEELERLFGQIHSPAGRKSYATKVHSMKNTAGTVGIIPLSGMAKVLEDAAKNDECDVVEQLTPVFLKRWRAYQELLHMYSDETEKTKNADEYQEEINAIYAEIKAAAEEMDIDALDERLELLSAYQFEGEAQEFFAKIKKAIINFDVDFLQEVL